MLTIAKQLLATNMSVEQMAQITGLSIDEVKKRRNKIMTRRHHADQVMVIFYTG